MHLESRTMEDFHGDVITVDVDTQQAIFISCDCKHGDFELRGAQAAEFANLLEWARQKAGC